jgi:catechol 2,3-dioxygenase-like lactoylglutathione lyase family enzyme
LDETLAILNPVMRCIGVADIEAATRFYRDLLGFEIAHRNGAVEATRGPACIRFGEEDLDPYNTRVIPRGSAILFFETDDVEAMWTAVRRRGGGASELSDANWIKMRMLEVRDPDGHAIWFAQSYAEPVEPGPQPMMRQALPEMPFDDVAAAIVHYRDVLGFHVNYEQHDLGVMDRDSITVLLISRSPKHRGIGSFEVYVEDADALYAELRANGAEVLGEPVSRPWGLRDFSVLDIEGNRITFAQPFE